MNNSPAPFKSLYTARLRESHASDPCLSLAVRGYKSSFIASVNSSYSPLSFKFWIWSKSSWRAYTFL